MAATGESSGNSPKAQYGKVTDQRLTADEMDIRRKENMAYEYLCHLEEAKVWIEACINEPLPQTTELEEGLRNGVFLAKLAHFMDQESVPLKKIYDKDLSRYQARGLHFRHTDNINHFLKASADIGMPKIFSPETTDIYDRKNIPRLIYCIHALSLYLFKLGRAPQIQDLYGKIKFTDEEISAMRKELEKYGIQMPAFSKIGGILANEMPVDEAALHAAIIAINEAIEQQDAAATVTALQIPAAHLININLELQENYQEELFEAKDSKAEIARNKSMDPDSSYIPDVYDELLTQAELQGNINKVNTLQALSKIQQAVHKNSTKLLLEALQASCLNIRNIKDQNANIYLEKLREMKENKKNNNNEEDDDDDSIITKEAVQFSVNSVNQCADETFQKTLALDAINTALEGGDTEAVVKALKNPKAQLGTIHEYAATLYHEELRNMRNEKQSSLDYEELSGGVTVLSAIAAINKAVDTGNANTLFEKLCEAEACIENLDEGCKEKYQEALSQAKSTKQKQFKYNLLTHFEIQQVVNDVNRHVVDENDRILAVNRINEAVDKGNNVETLAMLQLPSARLLGVDAKQAQHYQNLLSKRKSKRAKDAGDPSASLWYDEIQETVNMANLQAFEGNHLSVGIASINMAVDTSNVKDLLSVLSNNDVALHSVTPECTATYMAKLTRYKEKKKNAGEGGSGWMMNRLKEGNKFYFNVHSMEYSWDRFDLMRKDYTLLTRDEIQTCISEVTSAYDRQLLFKSNEKFIVKLQSQMRGYLARKKYQDRVDYMHSHIPAVVKLQAWWRMVRARSKYQQYMQYVKSNEQKVVMLQAAFRRYLARKHYLERLQFFRNNVQKVIKIQAFVRSKWAKQDFKMLMHGEDPPISVVRRFVHLLDLGDLDYTEEIELQRLKSQAVQDIRTNQQLENDLNQMDIKIGLLVKNRITLQDVVSHHKSLKKYSRDNSSSNLNCGIKALSKQSRERLEAYQHLFYVLQTNPVYLAKLIFEMPQNQTNKFMESVILTLLNYASNQREEYLLLKLFKTALKEEIRAKPYEEPSCKVDKMSDIVTGNPMVVKMIVSFNRNARGQGSLRDLLNPLVTSVIEDKVLLINTNPVEVYKTWVNQTETQSGKASGMPYEVTPEQALEHKEVRDRIQQSVKALESATERFLVAILNNIELIPYGMRYMAKVLRDALRAKFPQAPDKDILKIIGNLIYYRYINSAIVAPDAFDIIDVSVHKGLTTDQRRNLGSIAKILQFAASNKGFGGESAHLSCLNSYIMDAHNRFKKYFKAVCEVEEPEMRFNMDQYTDLTRVTKPVIYISIAEIIDTHKLLLEHQDTIAPDHNDILHELLEDLGEVPSVESLIGDVGIDENGTQNKNTLAKTEISLTLSSKFEVPDDDKSDVKSLLIRTKRMLVEVVRCQQSGDNITQILNIEATEQEELHHQALIKNRVRIDQRATANQKATLVRQQSLLEDTKLPLETMKERIRENLQALEKEKVVTRKNHYQAVINSVVQDMRNQRIYRQRRKQEMIRLRTTLKSLSAKRAFYEEQIDYYNQYVKTCLDNLSTKSKKSGRKYSASKDKGPKIKGSIKYSAAKLYEKGVVLEIEGLPTNQFKNVLFEIAATETPGVFDLNAKFMGVNMEKVELVFQDLLQLQYEGVAVMKMFDRARVNVNLLIFLLNKKFYGK